MHIDCGCDPAHSADSAAIFPTVVDGGSDKKYALNPGWHPQHGHRLRRDRKGVGQTGESGKAANAKHRLRAPEDLYRTSSALSRSRFCTQRIESRVEKEKAMCP